MSRVDLRIDDFEDGVLPRVCVVSGVPTERLRRFRFSHTPGAIAFALLLGPVGIPVVIVLAAITRRTVTGRLPVSAAIVERAHRWRRRGWSLVGAGVAIACLFGYVFDAFGGRDVLAIAIGAAIALGLTGLWIVARPPGSVGGRPDRSGRWVTVYPACDEFAVAYGAQEARRVAARRDAAGVADVGVP